MLARRLSLLQAVSLNMGMMVGVGPFITIPLFVAALGGPHAMIGWVIGAVIAAADGLVWSELAAAFPGSGGTFHFYDSVYGATRIGKLLKFLFVWQFLFSVPLELASGGIGLGQYLGFLITELKGAAWDLEVPLGGTLSWDWRVTRGQIAAVVLTLLIVRLAYRRIELAGRVMVVLWVGMLATLGWMIVAGLTAFDPQRAFAFPPDAFRLDWKFAMGLGAAVQIAMYDLFGYYQVCYLGDEVVAPEKTIPRAILISVLAVSATYLVMNTGVLGVLPVAEVMASEHIASDFMLARYGSAAATVITVMILWTGTASVFAGLLGYSRVPYAAARSGHFFGYFAMEHPTGRFPHRSLLVVGVMAALACLVDLPTVIGALIASRILIQFVGQIATVFHVRSRPELREKLVYRMPLFPIPALVALGGWLFVFGTLTNQVKVYGLGTLAAGAVAYWAFDKGRPMTTRSSGLEEAA